MTHKPRLLPVGDRDELFWGIQADKGLCGKRHGGEHPLREHEDGIRRDDEKDGRPRYGMLKARDQIVDLAHLRASWLIAQPPQPVSIVSGPPSPACRLHSCSRHRPSCSVCPAWCSAAAPSLVPLSSLMSSSAHHRGSPARETLPSNTVALPEGW